jgi:sporulation protein YlmC with PRC-barrel domain
MYEHEQIDLAYRLLDLDLVDSEGTRCGKVDDIELTGAPGEATYVSAVVSGPGALGRRFTRRLRPIGSRIFRGGQTRISWGTVADVEAAVKLERTAAQLGLGEGDRLLDRAVRRVT